MKSFERELIKVKSNKVIVIVISYIIAVVTLIYGIISLIPKEIEYSEFNKTNKTSSYAKTIVYYLMGPLITVTDSEDESVSEYYIAVGENEDMFFIRLSSEDINIPILGKDVSEDAEIDELEGVEVYGLVQLSSSSLRSALNNKLNELFDEEIASNDNFDQVWGGYHLDTVSKENNAGINFIITAVIFGIIGTLYLWINKRIRKNVDMVIKSLEEKGILKDVINEFEGEQLIEYNKLKVYLSPKYIFSFNNGFVIIDLKNIKEVTVSKRVRGDVDKNKYIIIVTKDDLEFYIAPIQKRSQKAIFNELLAKIKSVID